VRADPVQVAFDAMRSMSSSPDWIKHLDRLHLLTPLRVLAVIVIAAIITVFVRRVVKKGLGRLLDRALPTDRSRAEARHRALSSALRAALTGVIWAVAVITIISEVGVNIGGFVATATVVGGAIAFGAQTLIRDIIAGFFVLSDDQFGIGDQVDLGHASGVVERVTLRTARLRDGEGRIWHVAHGNVLRVGNLSKTTLVLLDIEVARAMPLQTVLDEAHHLTESLAADATVGPLLNAAPAVVGVVDLRDDRYVVRVTATAQLGKHDEVKRAWRALLLGAFESGALVAPTVAA